MRRIPLCVFALLLATTANGQTPVAVGTAPNFKLVPRVIQPTAPGQLGFLPYNAAARQAASQLPGAAALNALVPDTRELSGAAFMNTMFEPRRDYYYWLTSRILESPPEPVYVEPELDPTRVYLKLQVPDKAEVFLQGRLMGATGPERLFTSPQLAAGIYHYDVLVRWFRDGVPVQRRFDLTVQPGDQPVVVVMAPLEK